ncbi:hypothetical protein [Halobacterium litoreum]|uniref:Tat (Twin-arginine translocation) pathway signal sequence n=1 Tax=Halobacterium litoreum TaxID=2039234 RepID=A0ABD5ND60_9EURY|nr:hypothetical protein [Halobacterium litoreum]UHH13891.1 hypothetical protein LT972_02570 [Halobacterium litoreum]
MGSDDADGRDAGPTRRQVLAGGATATVGGLGALAYGTNNPVHRSSVHETATRDTDAKPTEGDVWTATHSPGVADADVEQSLAVRHVGADGGSEEVDFDVLAVAVGRRSTLLGNGGLLGTHRLGVRGVDDTGTRGVDSGEGDMLASGVVRPPEAVAEATGLDPSALDDPAAVRKHVVPDDRFEAGRDLKTARPLLARTDTDTGLADRLTLAGVVDALVSDATTARAATPEYEGRGETYRWPLDGVVAHAVRYRALGVRPGDDRLGLKVASSVPRPSLLGSPRFEGALVVSAPA